MIDFQPTEDQEMIRDTVKKFAVEVIRDKARECDEQSAVSEEILAQSWELGLVNGPIPEVYGGGGMDRSPTTSALLLEELGYGCVSLGTAIMAPTLFVQPIIDFGTEEQKKKYLPLFTQAQYHAGSLALQEPQFNFDPANLKTKADKKGDIWLLNGSKRLIPMGDRASHFIIVTRGAEAGLANLQAFIVPRDAKGLELSKDEDKTMGFESVPFVSLRLNSVEVKAADRLGGENGIDGNRLINCIRVGGGALAVGVSRAVTELSISYAKERVAFGSPIAQKQAIAFMIADMYSEVETMRWMVWKAASQLEQGTDATRSATLAQNYINRKAMTIADNGIQVFGGHGYIRDFPIEMWYRNTRAITLVEGPVAA